VKHNKKNLKLESQLPGNQPKLLEPPLQNSVWILLCSAMGNGKHCGSNNFQAYWQVLFVAFYRPQN